MNQPTLKIKGLVLRPLRKTDAASLARHANNKNIARNLSGSFPHPYTLDHAKQFIDATIKEIEKEEPRFITFGIEVDKEVVGLIEVRASFSNRSAEIGFWLGESHWGQNIMTGAVGLISRYCLNQLKLQRIEARVMPANRGSQRVLTKNGFKLEGKLRKALFKGRKSHDLILMAKVKSPDASCARTTT